MDELVSREFQAIRDQIASIERHHESQVAFEREQRRSEKSELDSRLTRMNEFRQAMQDQASRFITRPEFDEAVARSIERTETSRDYVDTQINAHISPVRAEVERLQRPDWGFFASAGSLLVAVVAGCWLVIGLQIDSRVQPIITDMAQNKTAIAQAQERLKYVEQSASASTQADASSRSDRAQLNERVKQIEIAVPQAHSLNSDVEALKTRVGSIDDRLQAARNSLTEQRAALIEVETQFCGQDNLRNQIHVQDLRWFSILWKKVFGDEIPTANAFYARVGKCASATMNSGTAP
jgi:SMC interacting uncharacterized protein involved in chromosome segregation